MKSLLKIAFILALSSCANMLTPTGGKKDIEAPKIITISKTLNEYNELEKIYLSFDEYISFNNWDKNFYISPTIENTVLKKITNKQLELHIKDKLQINTTYLFSLDNCIKDINEGNILENLQFIFSTSEEIDTLKLNGQLKDAYSLDNIKNAWVMLFEENRNDSIIFKENPNYIAKTNYNGVFNFPNLNDKNYKLVALTDYDLVYNMNDHIGFHDNYINTTIDSFVTLYTFNPIINIDSGIINPKAKLDNVVISDSNITNKDIINGTLIINTTAKQSSIFQLLQDNNVVYEFPFLEGPYILNNISPGIYKLKYIFDNNNDGKWNTGNWEEKKQPEKIINYSKDVIIRSNWDLKLDWELY